MGGWPAGPTWQERVDFGQVSDNNNLINALAFDTLEFAKRLRAADFTEKQAETLACAVAEIVESRLPPKEIFPCLRKTKPRGKKGLEKGRGRQN